MNQYNPNQGGYNQYNPNQGGYQPNQQYPPQNQGGYQPYTPQNQSYSPQTQPYSPQSQQFPPNQQFPPQTQPYSPQTQQYSPQNQQNQQFPPFPQNQQFPTQQNVFIIGQTPPPQSTEKKKVKYDPNTKRKEIKGNKQKVSLFKTNIIFLTSIFLGSQNR